MEEKTKTEQFKAAKSVQNVVATMAIENMFLDSQFVAELTKVAKGEKTSESLRQEIIRKYIG